LENSPPTTAEPGKNEGRIVAAARKSTATSGNVAVLCYEVCYQSCDTLIMRTKARCVNFHPAGLAYLRKIL
jgi:hypothetical protein